MTTPSAEVDATDIAGVVLTDLQSHEDTRGEFIEVMRQSHFDWGFRQSNVSRSVEGVLRGLHFHRHQADLWFLLDGRIQVGLVDIRRHEQPVSASLILSAETPQTLLIPPGVAHGFLSLSDCRLLYWVTQEFDSSDEYGIMWNDPVASIPWQNDRPLLSPRDRSNPLLDWNDLPAFRP